MVQHNQTTNEHHPYRRLTITQRTTAHTIPRKDLEDDAQIGSAHSRLTMLMESLVLPKRSHIRKDMTPYTHTRHDLGRKQKTTDSGLTH